MNGRQIGQARSHGFDGSRRPSTLLATMLSIGPTTGASRVGARTAAGPARSGDGGRLDTSGSNRPRPARALRRRKARPRQAPTPARRGGSPTAARWSRPRRRPRSRRRWWAPVFRGGPARRPADRWRWARRSPMSALFRSPRRIRYACWHRAPRVASVRVWMATLPEAGRRTRRPRRRGPNLAHARVDVKADAWPAPIHAYHSMLRRRHRGSCPLCSQQTIGSARMRRWSPAGTDVPLVDLEANMIHGSPPTPAALLRSRLDDLVRSPAKTWLRQALRLAEPQAAAGERVARVRPSATPLAQPRPPPP